MRKKDLQITFAVTMALSFRHLPGIFHDLTHTPLKSLRNLAPNGGGEGIQCYHLGETRNFENHGQRKERRLRNHVQN